LIVGSHQFEHLRLAPKVRVEFASASILEIKTKTLSRFGLRTEIKNIFRLLQRNSFATVVDGG